MNKETETILKALGFVLSDDGPDESAGTVKWFRPREPGMVIHLLPAAGPHVIPLAIFQAGGRAKREEIAAAHRAYIDSIHE